MRSFSKVRTGAVVGATVLPTVENVHGPRLAADTGSGSVTILDARVGELITDTGSGGITLRGVTSRHIRLDTGSGQVDLGLASGCESLIVDTGSGGVTVRVPAGFGARYRVKTGSGGIAIEVPHEKTQREDGRQSGQIGDGRGSVAIDTGSGGVRILRAAK